MSSMKLSGEKTLQESISINAQPVQTHTQPLLRVVKQTLEGLQGLLTHYGFSLLSGEVIMSYETIISISAISVSQPRVTFYSFGI